MVKKSTGVTMMGPEKTEDDIKPSLHLSGKHAKAFAKHKIGEKVKMVVHGKKTSHSMGSGGGHNIGFELNKITPFSRVGNTQNETVGE